MSLPRARLAAAGVLYYIGVFVLEAFNSKTLRQLVKLSNTAALFASIGLAYISLYILRDVCMVCVR